MNWLIPTYRKKNNSLSKASLISRLVLRRGETYRLPAISGGLQVVSGQAWVTMAGCDIFLGQGERLPLPASSEAVLVSGLSRLPLVLEVLGNRLPLTSGVILTAYPNQPGPI